jgi:hypothetical protein
MIKMTRLLLSNDTFFCYFRDDVVLLRLTANRYSLLRAKEASFLHELSKSHACTTPDSGNITAPDSGNAAAEALLQAGVLTRAREAGRPVEPTVASLPVEQLMELIPKSKPPFRAAHVAAFVWAASVATFELALVTLRGKGFDGPVNRIRRRNARLRPAADEARNLVGIFNELRIFWPRRYVCRFDSLALIHFLACFGVRAQWVFGVQIGPFAAHCWVQDEQRLYNDDLERIVEFQPIMVVA